MQSSDDKVRWPLFLKRFLIWTGRLLGIAGIVFVIFRLKDYAGQAELGQFMPGVWMSLSGLALVYGAANTALARAWWLCLVYLDVYPEWRQALRIYGWSQIAKYVPGNVFQFASRQAQGVVSGLPAKALGKSAALEIALLLFAGGLCSSLAAPLLFNDMPVSAGVLLFFVALAMAFVLLRTISSPILAGSALWYVVFLSISGSVFVCVLNLVGSESLQVDMWPLICGSYIIAWLVGFVTPGAPAGLGVREMMLLFLLGNQVPQLDLLLATVLGRIVTVVGDVLFMLGTSKVRILKSV